MQIFTQMMNPTIYPVLECNHSNVRDENIQLFKENHKYIILSEPDTEYTSVTTWIKSHFPKFDADGIIKMMMNRKNWQEGHRYWGLNPEEIKALWETNKTIVASAGTDLHFQIECFMNEKLLPSGYTLENLYNLYMFQYKKRHRSMPLEWQYFIQFVKDYPDLKPYRTEWVIYHEDVKISGSIDAVYENSDGTLSLYDWKRCKEITRINKWNNFAISLHICHLPDSNFWHYAIQLNTYKVILEDKYGKKVKDLFIVNLHPDATAENYVLIKMPDLSREVRSLFEEIKR